MKRCRRDLESQVSKGRNARLVIGGYFNAIVGINKERPGMCRKFGLGRTYDAKRNLIEWCE